MNNIFNLLLKALGSFLSSKLSRRQPLSQDSSSVSFSPTPDTADNEGKLPHPGRITHAEILMGRDKAAPLSIEQSTNLDKLVIAVNVVRQAYGKPMTVSSGYRPPAFNTQAGGAKRSCHLTCEACDFRDTKGELASWCLNNILVLEKAGLYMESPSHTKGWVHLQTRPTKNRVFIP